MAESNESNEVVKAIIGAMEARVNNIVESLPVPPGLERVDSRREARRRWGMLSEEQRRSVLQSQGVNATLRNLVGEGK